MFKKRYYPITNITSTNNDNIKKVLSLREKKYRDKYKEFLVEGLRELKAAINNKNIKLVELFVCETLLSSESKKIVQHFKNDNNVKIFLITQKIYSKISIRENIDGILGVFKKPPEKSLDDLYISDSSLIIIAENIEKPGNLGALIRTADACGITAVILSEKSCDCYNHNVIRASIGTVFTMPIIYSSNIEILQFCNKNNIQIFSTLPYAQLNYYDVNFKKASAIVLGSEAYGISKFWNPNICTPIKIPMYGYADSLNISVAGAIILYEAKKQQLTQQT